VNVQQLAEEMTRLAIEGFGEAEVIADTDSSGGFGPVTEVFVEANDKVVLR
jgi:hypothetical protein